MPKKLILVSSCAVVVLVTTIVLVLFIANQPLPQSPRPGEAEISSTTNRQQKTSIPDQTELKQTPVASQEDNDDSSSVPLFKDADPVTELKLQPWVDAYFADRKDADYITSLQLVEPSYELLSQIRYGEVASFRVLFKGRVPIQVEVIEVDEHTSSWFAWGSSPNHPGSIAEFTIEPDGSINAVISLPGIGQYGIRPSGELPYHLMYFTHGVSSYD
jgi:hypothetical protein